ncbi:MAG: glycoside hydrolase family 2 TIM barrel-domain containing protein [Aggregatilineales bacterium]
MKFRGIHPFNDNWLFCPESVYETADDSNFTAVTLPHTNKIFPHHNFDDAEYQFISTYRKRFTLPAPLNGRRLFLDFEGAMLAATVTINDHTLDEHKGGYTPFSYDITDYIKEDGENLLTVHLDSRERHDIPPFGYVVDYMTFGGIYREVNLRYVPPVHIEKIFGRAYDVLTDHPRLEVDVWVKNQYDEEVSAGLIVGLSNYKINEDGSVNIDQTSLKTRLPANSTQKITVTLDHIGEVERWSLDNPICYYLGAQVGITPEEVDDIGTFAFGFREATFKDDGFYLNGERVQLRGLNRHQMFPYFGSAAPERLQRRDADIIKYELGCNIVRTSHYPQSRHFLDRCDEIGLLVLEEIPGWQHIGDEAWKQISIRDVQAMIERDRNHPSIIIWGVRVNESQDDTEFYTATNTLARELDPTRPTGGIRYIENSEFLEDVFTFNDFSNGVREPQHTPYMITEFNGHMFPTKSFDNEERRVEHALRHAKIQAQAATMGGVSGAIGWCAFDYNTHKEFGSGDRICYHGVMDIFRLPKYAAHFYASQIDPKERIVLQAATIWSMGDRSAGGNDPLTIFSNCDEVEIFAGKENYGRFTPDFANYPNLPHPPFTITGLGMRWGEAFGDLRVIAYLNGQAVAEQQVACDGQPVALILKSDDDELRADGMDMTRIVFKIVEQYGNPLPYVTEVISFEVDGPAELIGTNPFPLIGGSAALYLRAGHDAGEVKITARTSRFDPVTITVKIG